jgi:iron complex outermembrane receptor protein
VPNDDVEIRPAVARVPSATRPSRNVTPLPLTRRRVPRRLLDVARRAFVPVICGGMSAAAAQAPADARLFDLSLEELSNLQVTSVSGRPEAARGAAASIFVITGEDIRRSTATSLPEALRLAPNLQVARLNATQYAISARGFNNTIGNKLLVLVDGRTVYSPLFSGVFWDAQDVVLEDVERIEVISGPGATLWGANAVNGVINVITRSATDTQGVLASVVAGPSGTRTTARLGGRLDDRSAYRVYAMRSSREDTDSVAGVRRADATDREQVGFRFDRDDGGLRTTVQGDAYRSSGDVPSVIAPRYTGANLLARWRRQSADGTGWQLQTYADQARREEPLVFNDRTRTLDVEFRYSPGPIGIHRLLWGVGHREARSSAEQTAAVLFDPRTRDLRWTNAFLQDEMQVTEHLRVTAGVKLETNVYTGAEVLPSLRFAYDPTPTSTFWGALSRAVRAPARLDRDFFFPARPPFAIAGGPDFRSEVAVVTELGYRGQLLPNASWSVTAFHQAYDGLRAGRGGPTTIGNLAGGDVWGLEAWGNLDVTPSWRLSAGFVELRKSLRAAPDAGPLSVENLGNDPKHQLMVRSLAALSPDVEADLTVRYVSALPFPAVSNYVTADLRLGWRISQSWHASLLAQDLGPRHVEFEPVNASRFGRAVFARIEWRSR